MNNVWKVQANLFHSILIELAGWIQRAQAPAKPIQNHYIDLLSLINIYNYSPDGLLKGVGSAVCVSSTPRADTRLTVSTLELHHACSSKLRNNCGICCNFIWAGEIDTEGKCMLNV